MQVWRTREGKETGEPPRGQTGLGRVEISTKSGMVVRDHSLTLLGGSIQGVLRNR